MCGLAELRCFADRVGMQPENIALGQQGQESLSTSNQVIAIARNLSMFAATHLSMLTQSRWVDKLVTGAPPAKYQPAQGNEKVFKLV
jgi:hypothetical protein